MWMEATRLKRIAVGDSMERKMESGVEEGVIPDRWWGSICVDPQLARLFVFFKQKAAYEF